MTIPFVEEKFEQNLAIQAAIESVVTDRFLFSDFHFGFGAEQLLFRDLLLFNGCAVFLGDLQTCEIEAANVDVVEFVQFLSHRALNKRGDIVPFGGDRDQLVLRKH